MAQLTIISGLRQYRVEAQEPGRESLDIDLDGGVMLVPPDASFADVMAAATELDSFECPGLRRLPLSRVD